jgi:fatty acid desaturase
MLLHPHTNAFLLKCYTNIDSSLFAQAVAAAKKAKRELTADEKALVDRVVSAANILVQVSQSFITPSRCFVQPAFCSNFCYYLCLTPGYFFVHQVDEFDKLGHEVHEDESYIRPALRGTKFAYMYETVNA